MLSGTKLEQIRDTLQCALNGLKWYYDMYPQTYSGVDEDMVLELQESIDIVESELRSGNAMKLLNASENASYRGLITGTSNWLSFILSELEKD